jgi:NTE family protein
VPVAFAPVVIKTFPQACDSNLPEWINRARSDPNAAPMLKAFADGITRYHYGDIPYIKLLDGCLVDNFGISDFTIARLSSPTSYGPLTAHQAVALRHVLFLVIDPGRAPSGDWVNTVEGRGGADPVMAAADTAIDASTRASFTTFERTNSEWHTALVSWRCGLSAAERHRIVAPAHWNCRDLKFFVGRAGFDELSAECARKLNAIPTRFKLPAEDIDRLIAAGADAVRANSAYKAFLVSLR